MTIEEVVDHFTDLTEDRSSRFEEMAGAVFAYQRTANRVYGRYCREVGAASGHPPFLPVEAFKHAPITTFEPDEADVVFHSSATGGGKRSRHYVQDIGVYERAVSRGFEHTFGADKRRLMAYLPEYAQDSSLVYMLKHLIQEYGAPGSGFFLEELAPLKAAVGASQRDGVPMMLFGAAFGLADLVSTHRFQLPETAVVVETGGMKTHRRETARTDLHDRLSDGFGIPRKNVRSEYGMCELMSQCYTRGEETFYAPPWVRCYVVDPSVPARELASGEPGAFAVVDLANVYSCSFLVTGDRAVKRGDGFEILGRLRDAELRGCNFLLENV